MGKPKQEHVMHCKVCGAVITRCEWDRDTNAWTYLPCGCVRKEQ